MARLVCWIAILALGGAFGSPALAHFHMLLPEKSSAKRDEAITFIYQWGHPFEHQLFDAPAPEKLVVLSPSGETTDLSATLEKTSAAPHNKKVTAYRFRFTPKERGDFVFVLRTPPVWMEEDQEFLQDTVKVVLHVQAQKNWDATGNGDGLALTPLTRPYGLQAGMVFQAQATAGDGVRRPIKAVDRAFAEIERYNAEPPKELPPDEHITRTAKTDPNGVVTCTLPEPGWWCVTVQRNGGERRRNGKSYPLKEHASMWVFVDESRK